MLSALALLAQFGAGSIPTGSDEPIVRLRLSASPIAPGDVLPVYVASARAGYLLVLHLATDGRVEVVFPTDPQADGHVGRGTHQLRAPGNRPGLVAHEPRGTGLVLAVLSGTPLRFAKFSQAGRWNRGLLVASHPDASGPGTLTDIARRMLGDGSFIHDFALYTVRAGPARPPAHQERRVAARGQSDIPSPATPAPPTIGVCNGCTIVNQTASQAPILEQTVVARTSVEPLVIVTSPCELFAGGCHGRHHRPATPRMKTAGICQIGVDCPGGGGGSAKAIVLRPRRP